jgi:hypothetical protein
MPNWASSKVIISGDPNVVTEIKEKLATPYPNPFADEPNFAGEPRKPMVEGTFLLWNIISPTDLYAYTEKDKKAFEEIVKDADTRTPEQRAKDVKESMDKFQASMKDGTWLEELQEKFATSQGWYEWNCREWGTKWELTGPENHIEYEVPSPDGLELCYRLLSAWSPPYEALGKLAERYPEISISLSSIDESDCWAMSAEWTNGEEIHADNAEITHELGMDLRGYCNLECCNEYE